MRIRLPYFLATALLSTCTVTAYSADFFIFRPDTYVRIDSEIFGADVLQAHPRVQAINWSDRNGTGSRNEVGPQLQLQLSNSSALTSGDNIGQISFAPSGQTSGSFAIQGDEIGEAYFDSSFFTAGETFHNQSFVADTTFEIGSDNFPVGTTTDADFSVDITWNANALDTNTMQLYRWVNLSTNFNGLNITTDYQGNLSWFFFDANGFTMGWSPQNTTSLIGGASIITSGTVQVGSQIVVNGLGDPSWDMDNVSGLLGATQWIFFTPTPNEAMAGHRMRLSVPGGESSPNIGADIFTLAVELQLK